jgi:hypothetical protein
LNRRGMAIIAWRSLADVSAEREGSLRKRFCHRLLSAEVFRVIDCVSYV